MAINAWDYVAGGSSITADNLLQASMKSAIELGRQENISNRDSTVQTAYVSYQVTGDAEKVFAATLTLPGRLTLDPLTGVAALKPKILFADLGIVYDPGAGTLAGTTHLADGVVKLAELCTYWERQVQSSIVTKTPNQITVNADLEASQFVIQLNIPATMVEDPLTFKVEVKEIDYFYILGTQGL